MALKDLIVPALPPPTPAAERPPGITCEQYTRGEGKRCLQYQQGGTCSLPGKFICTEWQKHNAPTQGTLPLVEAATVVAEPSKHVPPALDLFGNPAALPERPKPKHVATTSTPAASPSPAPNVDVDQLRGLTTEDIASFRGLGLEVRLKSEACGDLWLVPAYTGQPRKELTPEHAATVVRVLSAFPGSQVISFEKHSQPERPERLPRRP